MGTCNLVTRRQVLAMPLVALPGDGLIRQHELRLILELERRKELLAAGIRRRLARGAKVEAGRLGVDAMGDDDLECCDAGSVDAICVLGLNIGDEAVWGLGARTAPEGL